MMCCDKMLLRRGDGLEVRHRLDLKEKETLEVETAQNKHLRVCFYGCDDVCVSSQYFIVHLQIRE